MSTSINCLSDAAKADSAKTDAAKTRLVIKTPRAPGLGAKPRVRPRARGRALGDSLGSLSAKGASRPISHLLRLL